MNGLDQPEIQPMISENELIKQLRDEAKDVKGCFTNYSLQALGFSGVVLTAVFGAMDKFPTIVLSGIPMIILLMIIARVGIYKYATANRLYGYELHLARSRYLGVLRDSSNRVIWKPDFRKISWEEAQRAWRVVQTCIFRKVYRTPETHPILRRCHKYILPRWIISLWPTMYRLRKYIIDDVMGISSEEKYPWFMLKELTAIPLEHFTLPVTRLVETTLNTKSREKMIGSYHAGTFLKSVLTMITLMQGVLLLPVLMVICTTPKEPLLLSKAWLVTALTITLAVMGLRYLRIDRRREILEEELLSIHSCAIVWQIVVMAHYRAIGSPPCKFHNYTRRLALAAEEFTQDILDRKVFMGVGDECA